MLLILLLVSLFFLFAFFATASIMAVISFFIGTVILLSAFSIVGLNFISHSTLLIILAIIAIMLITTKHDKKNKSKYYLLIAGVVCGYITCTVMKSLDFSIYGIGPAWEYREILIRNRANDVETLFLIGLLILCGFWGIQILINKRKK